MTTDPQQQFTAAQIAQALGKRRESVLRGLAEVASSGSKIVRGKQARVWRIADLPSSLQEQIAFEAQRQGYRSGADLLLKPPRRWEPSLPLAEIAQHCLDKAAKLQKALAPSLERINDLRLSESEFDQLGTEDYKRTFGYSISAKHWRELFHRTVERDGCEENWSRLEIYLDANLSRRIDQSAVNSLPVGSQLSQLQDAIASFKNPASPSDAECRYLWLRIFEFFDFQVSLGKPAKRVKRELLGFLTRHAPFLAAGSDALRISFQRKYERWAENGREASALKDKRHAASGNWRSPILKAEDKDKIIAHAVFNCGGRVSQAWREILEEQGLSEELLSYYLGNPANKSAVPAKIRESVRYEIAMLADNHRGPRQAKLAGAWINRVWTDCLASDWYQADDVTLPIYYYEPDENGWFRLMRGQFLVMIDLRSTRIIGYALQSERNYNARVIRTLITKVADDHGLPVRGFYFEKGIWKKSKILKGDSQADPFSWTETELGLREFGMKFVHSNSPRSKPVEGVAGALQNLMEGEPGYVGRDEMHDKFERVQRAKLDVERKKVHPAEHFYSAEQWETRLGEICAKYNAAPQGGKMTQGLSPDGAFERFQNRNDPPIKFDASCRYLLAHHKRPIRVTSNGITLRFGKQVYNYRNEQTGELRGQTVLAWFNPELPEILAVTDMNRENPFCVARSQDVPAMDAPEELLEQELERIGTHMNYAKVRYRVLKAQFVPKFRSNVVDLQTIGLGREIENKRGAIEARQVEEQKIEAKARRVFKDLSLTVPPAAMRRPETVSAAERLAELLNEPEPSIDDGAK